MLIRSWNLFHGRTLPPRQDRSFARMVGLVCEGGPSFVLLQELAAWTLSELEGWSGYASYGAVASRPRVPGELGRRITDLEPNLVRSALEGQANAILVDRRLRVLEHRTLVLNPGPIRKRLGEELGLGLHARVSWLRERRVCHAVRAELADGRTAVVANLHATSYRGDKRIADAELLRAATFADGLAAPGEPVVLGGDFNVTVVSSPALRSLATPEWGFSPAGPGLDHVLVRGLGVRSPERRWPDERRLHGDVLLSDHAPVEIEVA